MRIYHISDLHFASFGLSPFMLFSKRLIGNLNYLFKRRFDHSYLLVQKFLDSLNAQAGDIVIISGDFTTTSYKKEFLAARHFIQQLKERGLKVFAIPGNHDTYTKNAHRRKSFYRYFETLIPYEGELGFNLRKDKVASFAIADNIHLVLIDCSHYPGYTLSTGQFGSEMESHLANLLSQIPHDDLIILTAHYPFFQSEHPSRRLIRRDALKQLLEKYPNVQLYLHGHTHRHTIADLRGNGLPLILDSGSLSYQNNASYNLLQLLENQIKVNVFRYQQNEWEAYSSHEFQIH